MPCSHNEDYLGALTAKGDAYGRGSRATPGRPGQRMLLMQRVVEGGCVFAQGLAQRRTVAREWVSAS
ncbi:MAG: hypothetical protein ACJAVR_003491 [Paracoccaceae bacterium]|jgi:hypothetical protein